MAAHGGQTQATSAERARSVLAAASSLTVTTEGHRCDLTGLHRVGSTGRLFLQTPARSHLTAEVAHAPNAELAALVELTDIAPTPVRDRVRARVSLRGNLRLAGRAADGAAELRFDPAGVELAEAGRRVTVGLDEFAIAQADPLATVEASTLASLEADHHDVLVLLSRLIEPRLLAGAIKLRALRLDRYGFVLRLEHARTHRDVRLPFPSPADNADQAERHIQTLLARAGA